MDAAGNAASRPPAYSAISTMIADANPCHGSGHLGNTEYGSIIDQFDAVGRANQAPLLVRSATPPPPPPNPLKPSPRLALQALCR